MSIKKFPFYKQLNSMDCGPTCLRMICKYYGKHVSAETIRLMAGYNKLGVSLLDLSVTAEKLGFRTRGVRINVEQLLLANLPAILYWNQRHFVVLISINKLKVKVADPANNIVTYTKEEFLDNWISYNDTQSIKYGTALLLEPTATFYESQSEKGKKLTWSIITQYLTKSKRQIFQVFLASLIGMVLQMSLPFLTQSMVDTGINTRNLQYITIVLFAQLMLSFSSTIFEYIRSRIQLRISNIINISILSDFWIKLTRLPLSYFDTHHAGDTIQRLGDNNKIQAFLTGQSMSTIFSILNFLVYTCVLIMYSSLLFFVFTLGNILYFLWVRLFLITRRKINFETFKFSSLENSATLQLIQGMQEIRLNNAEQLKRWEWENIQAKIFKLNFKAMNYGQLQTTGAMFISRTKDIIISFMVAQMVVKGELSFGTMLAIQYIIGQLNGPMQQFIGLTQEIQDARISMERLNEIHEIDDEEPINNNLTTSLPVTKNLVFKQFSFSYPGASSELVLNNINLTIEEGKVTAIVGASGSGKTTLLKLILKVYSKYNGEIAIGESNFKYISPSFWRMQCGSVLQDGYIFNDTIFRNISICDEQTDLVKFRHSCTLANILQFIESLPNGPDTKIGADGIGISEGQRQRILIARAIYRNPTFLIFDEATNSLDSNNEKEIVQNLEKFYEGRTVIVVAHRLSTVKKADKIVVLEKGQIVEVGIHKDLIQKKGHYYRLIKNQLELDT